MAFQSDATFTGRVTWRGGFPWGLVLKTGWAPVLETPEPLERLPVEPAARETNVRNMHSVSRGIKVEQNGA
jgi:hypothetical protein